jgi:hypothetical protein
VHVVDPVAGQLAVVGVAQHVEVDVAATGVGVPVGQQPLDQLDHLGNVAGGTRFGRRGQYAEGVVSRGERPLVGGRPLPPRPAGVGRLVEDLVVDVGDVADEGDVETLGRQPATQYVERDAAADMPDVGQSLDGGPAEVDRGVPVAQGYEVTDHTRHGVVKS